MSSFTLVQNLFEQALYTLIGAEKAKNADIVSHHNLVLTYQQKLVMKFLSFRLNCVFHTAVFDQQLLTSSRSRDDRITHLCKLRLFRTDMVIFRYEVSDIDLSMARLQLIVIVSWAPYRSNVFFASEYK